MKTLGIFIAVVAVLPVPVHQLIARGFPPPQPIVCSSEAGQVRLLPV
jgi:hypothetical protein